MNIQYIFIFDTNITLLKIKKAYKYTRDMYIYIKTAKERFVSFKKRKTMVESMEMFCGTCNTEESGMKTGLQNKKIDK